MTLNPIAPENRARLVVVLLALFVLFGGVVSPRCAAVERPGAAYVERAAALAFNGAAIALEVLDAELRTRIAEDAERRNLAALPDEELALELGPWARRVAELERARDALAIARAWLSGERATVDGHAALRDAAKALEIVADELEAHGAPIPERVREGIRAARSLAGAARVVAPSGGAVR